jgi:hypothetical protein
MNLCLFPKLRLSKCINLVVVGTAQTKDIRPWSVGQFSRANSDIGMFQHPFSRKIKPIQVGSTLGSESNDNSVVAGTIRS